MAVVTFGSHVTLHYRLAVLDGEREHEIISTLGNGPATLQLGTGQLAPALEERLVGLDEGACATFDLESGRAFGPHDRALVQALTRAAFEQHAGSDQRFTVGDVLQFNRRDGGRLAGVLTSQDDARVVVDFNHPLAGQAVRFSVQVIGVL